MTPFGPGANLAMKAGLLVLVLGTMAAVLLVWAWPRTDYATGRDRFVNQPVPFSHEHHVGGLGLDCRYCHATVETAATAGMPATDTCMTCHSQLWTNAAMLAPVRRSLATDTPLHWRRVNTVPDYVYFDHSIHIAKGVGCETCHGRVDRMPLTRQAASLHMGWCLSCHRDPAPNLRPRGAVFTMGWTPGPGTPSPDALMRAYAIHPKTLTDCTVCHR